MATVLVLEDRPMDRKVLVTLLTAAGHRVFEAPDGAEGLELAERVRPALVISDILMPTVDGYEFVRRLRAIPSLAHTPVIFYTATYHQREARVLAAQCGVAAVLTKPSEPRVLLERINSVLSSIVEPSTDKSLDLLEFNRKHARVLSSALESKTEAFEASEQRMAVIVDLAHQIAAERSAAALLKRSAEAAREVTLAQHSVISMLAEDDTTFERAAWSGIDEGALREMSTVAVGSPLVAPVIRERRPVRVDNPTGHPERIGLPADHPPTYSCLVVPVASPGRVYGCLSLRNKLGRDTFDEQDEEVALTLATHAGIAYENTQLFESLRQRGAALEQENAERRRAEVRAEVAMAAARMGIWEMDLVTGRVEWSESLATLFGLDRGEAPATREAFIALIHPEDRAALEEGLVRAIRDRTDLVNEFRTVWPDGTAHWIAGRARMEFDDAGSPTRLIGVGMDIDARKSLEAQFRQAQKMEAIGQLAGGVAHDFNNLLTVMRGNAELVLPTLTADDPRRADIGQIIQAADRAVGLTRQLLAFSRKQVLQPTTLDVNDLVTHTVVMLRRLIGENIELTTRLTEGVWPIHADAGQVEQVLMNLAVNARDAMPGGGRLSIRTANVVLDDSIAMYQDAVTPGPYVVLEVADTGIGMDERTRQRIFEPFFTTKPRGRGTGLGLATVYGIAKQSGGYISVYSEPGRGTTFKVYLPRAEGAAAGTTAAAEESPVTGTETVLLVEDEQAVRYLSQTLLERAGYRVLAAPDPAAAERLSDSYPERIDLLLTDVVMPVSGGPTLFRRLSARRPELKVLYMSGYPDDTTDEHGGLPAGVSFLQKPFTRDALLRKVRETIDR